MTDAKKEVFKKSVGFEVDALKTDGNEMTLQEFIDNFEKEQNLQITMISCGTVMLYSFFMSAAKRQERLKMPVCTPINQGMHRQPHHGLA